MKPELSFPEFNREWDYNLFSEIVTNKSKRCDPKNEESLKDIELDSIEQNTGRLLNTYMSKDFTSQKNKFAKGSVLYSKLRPYLNKYYYAKIDGVCSSEIWVLNSLYSQKLSNLFLYYFIQTNRFSNVANKSAGSKMPRADWSLVENIRLYKGSIEEQRKIGDFFSKLDRQIELEEKKLELLEQQKKGYMQKIFSQELRFKDENEDEYPDWSKTLIKDIFVFENNRRKPINSTLREKGNYPYYGATGIIDYVKDYLFNNEERLLIGEDGAKWGQFETSSFIANGKYWVNNHAHVVKSNNHNLYFMNYYLNFKELRTFVTGNAPAKLTHANLSSISIEMPIRKEQDKISYLLKDIENRINNQNTKIQLLQQRKQGLLQKMFV